MATGMIPVPTPTPTPTPISISIAPYCDYRVVVLGCEHEKEMKTFYYCVLALYLATWCVSIFQLSCQMYVSGLFSIDPEHVSRPSHSSLLGNNSSKNKHIQTLMEKLMCNCFKRQIWHKHRWSQLHAVLFFATIGITCRLAHVIWILSPNLAGHAPLSKGKLVVSELLNGLPYVLFVSGLVKASRMLLQLHSNTPGSSANDRISAQLRRMRHLSWIIQGIQIIVPGTFAIVAAATVDPHVGYERDKLNPWVSLSFVAWMLVGLLITVNLSVSGYRVYNLILSAHLSLTPRQQSKRALTMTTPPTLALDMSTIDKYTAPRPDHEHEMSTYPTQTHQTHTTFRNASPPSTYRTMMPSTGALPLLTPALRAASSNSTGSPPGSQHASPALTTRNVVSSTALTSTSPRRMPPVPPLALPAAPIPSPSPSPSYPSDDQRGAATSMLSVSRASSHLEHIEGDADMVQTNPLFTMAMDETVRVQAMSVSERERERVSIGTRHDSVESAAGYGYGHPYSVTRKISKPLPPIPSSTAVSDEADVITAGQIQVQMRESQGLPPLHTPPTSGEALATATSSAFRTWPPPPPVNATVATSSSSSSTSGISSSSTRAFRASSDNLPTTWARPPPPPNTIRTNSYNTFTDSRLLMVPERDPPPPPPLPPKIPSPASAASIPSASSTSSDAPATDRTATSFTVQLTQMQVQPAAGGDAHKVASNTTSEAPSTGLPSGRFWSRTHKQPRANVAAGNVLQKAATTILRIVQTTLIGLLFQFAFVLWFVVAHYQINRSVPLAIIWYVFYLLSPGPVYFAFLWSIGLGLSKRKANPAPNPNPAASPTLASSPNTPRLQANKLGVGSASPRLNAHNGRNHT